jgi:hypothetical protein
MAISCLGYFGLLGSTSHCSLLILILIQSSKRAKWNCHIHRKIHYAGIYIHFYINHVYTGCTRRNVPYFGRVFLILKYTDITQNTYVQSWTVTEIMAREKCVHVSVPRTIPKQLWNVICLNLTSACDKRKLSYLLSPSLPRHESRIVVGTQMTTTR